MKKNLFYYLFAMICSVALFASCSDDDDEVTGLTIDQVVGTFTGQLEVLNQSIPGTSIFVTKVGTFIKYYKIIQLIHTQSIAN